MKLIKNALIPDCDKENWQNCFILYDNKIREISSNAPYAKVDKVIDLKEKLLIPGAIDAHVHFNDPGFNHHEDFYTGSQAAAAGGITTVVDMPCTSLPPVTSASNLLKKISIIKHHSIIDFALWGGIRGNDLPNNQPLINELWEEGVVGFKIYIISGMDTFSHLSYQQVEQVLSLNPDKLFAFHAEDLSIINLNNQKLDTVTTYTWQDYLSVRNVEAEFKAVKQILDLKTSSPLHFVHISSKNAADLIIKAKTKRDISLETCPHYLAFTCKDFDRLKGRLKTAPPVKYEVDRDFLNSAVINGEIDYITTDHAGCNFETEKNLSDFKEIYSGIPGTQLMMPFLASNYLLNNKISPAQFSKLTSTNPAKRLGLYPQKGSLICNSDADFTIIDQNKPLLVNESDLYSKGKYSPFINQTFSCSIDKTIVRGKIVYDSDTGFHQNPGYGKWIKRG